MNDLINTHDTLPVENIDSKVIQEVDKLFEDPEVNLILKNLPPETILAIHSLLIFKASNTVRKNIEEKVYDYMPLKKVFNEIHKEYFDTDNLNQQSVAAYDAGEFTSERIANFDGLMEIGRARKWDGSKLSPDIGALNYAERRDYEMNSIRYNRATGATIIGTPSIILHELSTDAFNSLEDTLNKLKTDPSIPDYQKYFFSVAAATVLDTMHYFGDGNGRSSEDFMVEMQRRMFDDITKVKTWSQDGLRAKGLNNKFSPQLSSEYVETYENRHNLLGRRGNGVMELRQRLGNLFVKRVIDVAAPREKVILQRLLGPQDKVGEIKEAIEILEKYFYSRPRIIYKIYMDIIQSIGTMEGLIKYSFFGSDISICDILVKSVPDKYEYNFDIPVNASYSASIDLESEIERSKNEIRNYNNFRNDLISNPEAFAEKWKRICEQYETENNPDRRKLMGAALQALVHKTMELFNMTDSSVFQGHEINTLNILRYFMGYIDLNDNIKGDLELFFAKFQDPEIFKNIKSTFQVTVNGLLGDKSRNIEQIIGVYNSVK